MAIRAKIMPDTSCYKGKGEKPTLAKGKKAKLQEGKEILLLETRV